MSEEFYYYQNKQVHAEKNVSGRHRSDKKLHEEA